MKRLYVLFVLLIPLSVEAAPPSVKPNAPVAKATLRRSGLKHSRAWYKAIEDQCRFVRYELSRQQMHRELTDAKYRATIPGWNGNAWPIH